MIDESIEIDSDHVGKFREWIESRGGILRWENLEIASGASREVFTPALTSEGQAYGKPHWRYGNPMIVDLDKLVVRQTTVLESFRGRSKAYYWGPGLSEATEAKAKRLSSRSPELEYRYTFTEPGYALVEICKIKRVSFRELITMEVKS